MSRKIMHADLNSRVGEVKVYACPHCRDGAEEERLTALVARYEAALRHYADLHASEYGVRVPSKIGDRARAALAKEGEEK